MKRNWILNYKNEYLLSIYSMIANFVVLYVVFEALRKVKIMTVSQMMEKTIVFSEGNIHDTFCTNC